jgi:hypothetical protein
VSRNKKQDYVRSIYDGFRNNPERNRKAIEERMYLRIFTEIACARFKWVGLPTGIDERFLELTLFNRALSVFYFDEEFDRYFALRASGTGKINMYDNPTSYTVIGNTMINKTLQGDKCVPIWANFLRMPDWDIASVYAMRCAEIDRTIEINLMAHRHPYIVGTNALGDVMDSKVKLLDMKIDKDEVLNLQLVKGKMWNECMTFLGINNANQDKRERLVVSEVSANNSQVLMARNVALDARNQACEIINSMYDLKVSVHWNVDIDNIAAEKAAAGSPGMMEA